MSGTLLPRRARELAPVWRRYWAERWTRIPDWPMARLEPFLTAEAGRKEIREKRRTVARPPLIVDYPDGRAPFLGIMSLGAGGMVSPEAGALQYPMRGHLLTVAPTRTGKGTCHIVPNLLLYGGSCLAIDVKGENHALTAKRRATMFPGARVHRFAPLEATSACYNPLDFIRTEANGMSLPVTYDDARLVSEMLLPSAKNDFWELESRNLLTVLLMFVAVSHARHDQDRCMRTVISLLFSAKTGDETQYGIHRVLNRIIDTAEKLGETILVSLASTFLEHEERVFSGIVSSCRAGMHIWHSPNLLRATDRSDFLFSDLKAAMCRPPEYNPAPLSLYIVIPPQNLREYRGILRMMVGLAIAELTREPEWTQFGFRQSPPCDVLFLLDELPILGYMGPIVDGLAYLAGYGIKLWTFAQNLGQLKEIYGEEAHNFTANAGAMSFFGVNDPETANYVSSLLGKTELRETYYTFSESTSSGTSTSTSIGSFSDTFSRQRGESGSTSQNLRVETKEVVQPSEIRSLHPDLQFVFIRNTAPILAMKMPYYDFPPFAGHYGEWKGGAGV